MWSFRSPVCLSRSHSSATEIAGKEAFRVLLGFWGRLDSFVEVGGAERFLNLFVVVGFCSTTGIFGKTVTSSTAKSEMELVLELSRSSDFLDLKGFRKAREPFLGTVSVILAAVLLLYFQIAMYWKDSWTEM